MIIADSSFIIAFFNTDDKNHAKALKIKEQIDSGVYGSLCITDYIFDECATVLSLRLKNRKKVIQIGNNLKKMIKYRIDDLLFERSWEIFRKQKNTNLSFTDCTIIAVMRNENIPYITTFDKDFQGIMGINILEEGS